MWGGFDGSDERMRNIIIRGPTSKADLELLANGVKIGNFVTAGTSYESNKNNYNGWEMHDARQQEEFLEMVRVKHFDPIAQDVEHGFELLTALSFASHIGFRMNGYILKLNERREKMYARVDIAWLGLKRMKIPKEIRKMILEKIWRERYRCHQNSMEAFRRKQHFMGVVNQGWNDLDMM